MKPDYGTPLEEMTPTLRQEILECMKWKQRNQAVGRKSGKRMRPVSAELFQASLRALHGYATNIRGMAKFESLVELVQREIIEGYLEWAVDERGMLGGTIHGRFVLLLSLVRNHPTFKGLDFSWLKELMDGITVESDDEMQKSVWPGPFRTKRSNASPTNSTSSAGGPP